MIASFGEKTFEVSDKKIYTPSEISLSESLSYETQERAGDKPAIYVKGQGELTQSLTVHLDARWVNVQQEFTYWLVKMRTAVPEILTLGSRAWGAGPALLTSVSLADLVIAGDGSYLSANLSLSFVEYVAAGTDEDGNPGATGPGIKASRIQLEELMVKQ